MTVKRADNLVEMNGTVLGSRRLNIVNVT